MSELHQRLLKVTSVTQQQAIVYIEKVLKEQNTIIVESLVKESGISRAIYFPVIDLLEVAGLISTSNRGRKGIYIHVEDDKGLKSLSDKIYEKGIPAFKIHN